MQKECKIECYSTMGLNLQTWYFPSELGLANSVKEWWYLQILLHIQLVSFLYQANKLYEIIIFTKYIGLRECIREKKSGKSLALCQTSLHYWKAMWVSRKAPEKPCMLSVSEDLSYLNITNEV